MPISPEPEQVITYKPYMISLLKRLQSSRALVSVTIDKDKTVHNTIIIDALASEQWFFLDEVNSASAHKNIRKGSTIHFNGRIKGVQVKFETQVLAVEDDNNIAMYRLALPEKMLYRQRRQHFRAAANHDQHLGISIPIPLKQHLTGSIVDISAGGFCSRLDLLETNTIQEQQSIFDATISLPGHNSITCDIEVRSVRHYPEQGYTLVGGKFIEIEPHMQTHVERIVAMLDRNQRRSARL